MSNPTETSIEINDQLNFSQIWRSESFRNDISNVKKKCVSDKNICPTDC